MSWTRADLEAAQASGVTVHSRMPGLCGRVVRLRLSAAAGADAAAPASDTAVEWVELALPFPGRAVLRVGELLPAARLAVGARVRTPFGRGRVLAARAGGDYEVELVDNRLAGWTAAAPAHARGYLRAADVALRGDVERTAEEAIADADASRARGNAAFKDERFDEALKEYHRSSEVLSTYKAVGSRRMDAETRRLFLDAFLKSIGNSAATYLKLTPPDYEKAVALTTEAIDIDGDDIAKQRAKNFRRRGMALFAVKAWARAADDLKNAMADKAFANDPETREKYAEARAAARKEAEREKKTWQGAFAKLGGSADAAADGADDGGAAAAAKVRFSSPAAGAGARAPRATPLSAAGDDADAAAAASPAAYKRTMFAGHTPHPRRAGAAAGGADAEDEDADAGFSPKKAAGAGAGAAGGTATEEVDDEDLEEEGDEGSLWPWMLGGAAVLALGAGAAYMLSRRRQ